MTAASEGTTGYQDAPSGDLLLDDIFGDTSTPTTVVQAETKPAEQEPEVTQESTTQSDPVIKTKTGTVYKTLGDAVQGIEHKDALIAELRAQVKNTTGADPLRKREEPNKPVNYTENNDQYFSDIGDALKNNDKAAYLKAQQKLIWDSLGPVAPTLVSLSRANAERVVSEQYPEFKGFLSSEDFAGLEKDSPLLADAIRSAEMNPAAASQLPELYKVAYLSVQGRKVPEIVQSVRTQSQTQARPTVHSTQVSPPPVTGVHVSPPSLDTKEGRKAIIESQERNGVLNLKW